MRIKQNFIYLAAASLIFGIFFYKLTPLSRWIVIGFLISTYVAIILITSVSFYKNGAQTKQLGQIKFLEKAVLLLVIVSFFAVGFFRMSIRNYIPLTASFYDQTAVVYGTVRGEAKIGPRSKRYEMLIEKISINSPNDRVYFFNSSKEKIIFSVDLNSEFKHGDYISIRGKINKPQNFTTDIGTEFDYINFLAKDDIHGLMNFSQIELVKSGKFNFTAWLFDLKSFLQQKISNIIPQPEDGLLRGLLLGDKYSMSEKVENNFRTAGLTHVVVFSGFHVALIIILIYKITIFLPRYFKYFLATICAISLAIMMGSGSTVVRASTMAIFVIMGKLLEKNYQINRSLCLTAILMLLYNPLVLFHDISFRLSFAATIGIVNLTKKIEEKIIFVTSRFGLRRIVSATSAAQLSVLPIILNMSGELSIVALPVNVLILPLIPATMMLGFLMLFIAVIIEPPAFILGYFLHRILQGIIYVVTIFAELPFSSIRIGALEPIQIVLFYGFLIIFFYKIPIQIFEKIFNVLSFPARLIIRYKSMLPHINHQQRNRRI